MMMRVLVGVLVVAGVACGTNDESLAKRAGNKVGETATEFASGIGKGVDNKMVVEVELAPEVLSRGLSKTVAKSTGIDTSDKGFSVYLISKEKFAGTLIAKALAATGEEIGRSKQAVSFAAEDAQYVTFKFHREMDTAMVAKYVVSLGT